MTTMITMSTITTNTTIAANIGGSISFGGYYTGTSNTHWAAIKGARDNATSGQYGGYLSFYTRPNGLAIAEVGRFTSGGDFFVNSTSQFYWQNTNGRLGLKQSSPTSSLHVAGSVATTVTTTSSNLTLGETHHVVLVNNAATITLPDAGQCSGREYFIKSTIGAATVTINTTSLQNIDGTTSKTITVQYRTLHVVSNGTQWYILSEFDGTF